mgnify:FL=1
MNPVGWGNRTGGVVTCYAHDSDKCVAGEYDIPLVAIPKGWKLTPIESTMEMHFAGIAAFHNPNNQHGAILDEVFTAMLSAAPEALISEIKSTERSE